MKEIKIYDTIYGKKKEVKINMLLNRIEKDKKKLFLQLVKKTMEADGFVSNKEEEIYKEFCTELGFALKDVEADVSRLSSEDIIQELRKNCSLIDRRLIAFEIITIAVADDGINEKENEVINDFCNDFGITDKLKEDMIFYAESYLQIQGDIISLIGL